MKHTIAAGLVLIFSLAGSGSAHAQPATTSTPTTRILAIGTIKPGVDIRRWSRTVTMTS